MGILRGLIDHTVIASLALTSFKWSRQNEILMLCNDVGKCASAIAKPALAAAWLSARRAVCKSRNGSA